MADPPKPGKKDKRARKDDERERLREQRAALTAERAAVAHERAALDSARRAIAAELARAEALRDEYAGHEPVTAMPVLPGADADGSAGAGALQAPRPAPLVPALHDVAGGPAGARLCFAEPVVAGGRTLVPVARVRTFAGHTDARPVGVLEVAEDGVRLQRLDGGRPRPDLGTTLAVAAAGLLSGAALALGARRRSTRGRRRPWPR